jgi:single-stranded-DNA-specific exonuclease
VAARVREATHRPTIVLGKQPEPTGPWKGSGRSIPEYDLGSGIRAAAKKKILLGGGGHPMAAGMAAESAEKIAELEHFMNTHCCLDESVFTPAFEILGSMNQMAANEWWKLLEQLQPFGQGHAPLYFTFEEAELTTIKELGDSGDWFLLTIELNRNDHRIKASAAQAESLSCGKTISGVVSLSQKVRDASRIFYNWTLEAFEQT